MSDLQAYVQHTRNKKHRAALCRMNDEDLMGHFQAGTLEAFNILVARYTKRLQYYLWRFVPNTVLCQDLVQETFLRVYQYRHSYRRIARFSTWLYTIAGNLGRTEYRKGKRRHMYSLQAINQEHETYEVQIPDAYGSPERSAAMAIQQKYIQKALCQLPEMFREVVVLRDIQDLSYVDIASITGLPMGTVKSRINRGRKRMKSLLRDVYPFNPDRFARAS